ncbi:hypothetical protein [Nocardia sp. X0981]
MPNAVTFETGVRYLVRYRVAVEVVHDARPVPAFDGVEGPAEERVCLAVEAEAAEDEDGEGGVQAGYRPVAPQRQPQTRPGTRADLHSAQHGLYLGPAPGQQFDGQTDPAFDDQGAANEFRSVGSSVLAEVGA